MKKFNLLLLFFLIGGICHSGEFIKNKNYLITGKILSSSNKPVENVAVEIYILPHNDRIFDKKYTRKDFIKSKKFALYKKVNSDLNGEYKINVKFASNLKYQIFIGDYYSECLEQFHGEKFKIKTLIVDTKNKKLLKTVNQ